MTDHGHDQFNLSDFVLGYLEEQGCIVAPSEYNIHEVLLTDPVADQLGIDQYQRLTFGRPGDEPLEEDVLQLSLHHPLVESIAQAIKERPTNGHAHISRVRLDKRGLDQLARKTFQLPNAWVEPAPDAAEQSALHHYLRLNFRVTFVSDEKQEEIKSVVMDVQAGHSVDDTSLLERLRLATPGAAANHLSVAGGTLRELVPRAERVLRCELADQVATLASRMQRYLVLDLARIEGYYDELARDLKRRSGRRSADGADAEGLEDKLTALEAERSTKLQDVHGRYTLRVELKLINALLIAQPKVILPVLVRNRTACINRTAVWDPLVHRLEPLVCDVCGEPGQGLHLCTGGHLAHAECLAPQCIDCKRAYCRLCAEQIDECVVCHQPVCRKSLIACSTCKRDTCREHQQLCHAADGEPAALPDPPAPTPEPQDSGTPVSEKSRQKDAPAPSSRRQRPASATEIKRRAKSSGPVRKPVPTVRGVRIDVEIREAESAIVAFVMRSTRRFWAVRSFVLTPQGIRVQCECEKNTLPGARLLLPAVVDACTRQTDGGLPKEATTRVRCSGKKDEILPHPGRTRGAGQTADIPRVLVRFGAPKGIDSRF